MGFELARYVTPDFTQEMFVNAPEAEMAPAPKDMAAPDGFHAMSIFPEYFKVGDKWLLPRDSRMDCVAVYEKGEIFVREFRNIRKGDMIFLDVYKRQSIPSIKAMQASIWECSTGLCSL